MKKVFFALAIVAMFSFAACGNNEETPADTTANTEINEQTPAEDATAPEAEATDENAPAAENAENAENADAPAAETK